MKDLTKKTVKNLMEEVECKGVLISTFSGDSRNTAIVGNMSYLDLGLVVRDIVETMSNQGCSAAGIRAIVNTYLEDALCEN